MNILYNVRLFNLINVSMKMQARPLCTKALENETFEGLVDPRLEDNYDKQEIARMVACAAASVRHSARRRPRMSQVYIWNLMLCKACW